MSLALDLDRRRNMTEIDFARPDGPTPSIGSTRILVVEQDLKTRTELLDELDQMGHICRIVASVEEAESWLATMDFDVILADMSFPRAIQFLFWTRERSPGLPVILLTDPDGISTAIEWTGTLARTYLTKPVRPDILRLAVGDALAVSLRQAGGRDSNRTDRLAANFG